jgi:hypothetical protein
MNDIVNYIYNIKKFLYSCTISVAKSINIIVFVSHTVCVLMTMKLHRFNFSEAFTCFIASSLRFLIGV